MFPVTEALTDADEEIAQCEMASNTISVII